MSKRVHKRDRAESAMRRLYENVFAGADLRIHGELDCRRPKEEHFSCAKCGCLACWCFGAADDHFELCDDCASQAQRKEHSTL